METTVVGLYIHGDRSTEPEDTSPIPMLATPQVDAVEGMGLRQDTRYFRPADPGGDRRRQVSLIDEGTIWRHEAVFGSINRAFIKAQIVLEGDVHLPSVLGQHLMFADGAVLKLALPRKPCYAMDLIAPGLRDAMQGGWQGALATVIQSGMIAMGQRVVVLSKDEIGAGAATDR
jgi:MOSC domain-containing protein YiiM